MLRLEAYPQLHLILTLAIYNNYPMFKDVIDDDVLYLIISRFLPYSNRYSADASSNNRAQSTSVVSSFELFAYGNIDSELISIISSFPNPSAKKLHWPWNNYLCFTPTINLIRSSLLLLTLHLYTSFSSTQHYLRFHFIWSLCQR